MALLEEGLRAHLVDPDTRRRAELSRLLAERGIHAEIYEDREEYRAHSPRDGIILALDAEEEGSATEFVHGLARSNAALAIVAYSEAPEPRRIVEAMRSGLDDYLKWPITPKALDRTLEYLNSVLQSRLAVERDRRRAKELVGNLTARELDILTCLVDGAANKEIARDLGISPRTVETYRKNMMSKLQANSLVQAVRIALHAGLWDVHSAVTEIYGDPSDTLIGGAAGSLDSPETRERYLTALDERTLAA